MKDFFRKIGYKIKASTSGRYGVDALSWTLVIASLVLNVIGRRTGGLASRFILIMCLVMLVFAIYRTYSRNIEKRRQELAAYNNIFRGPINSFKMMKLKKQDPSHLYIKCPKCKTILRAPKGKGRIIMTCPKCQNKTEVRS